MPRKIINKISNITLDYQNEILLIKGKEVTVPIKIIVKELDGWDISKLFNPELAKQGVACSELLYQTYGKAQMARQIEVLTQSEFMEINHMTAYFMNTDKEYISHCNRDFRESGALT